MEYNSREILRKKVHKLMVKKYRRETIFVIIDHSFIMVKLRKINFTESGMNDKKWQVLMRF